MRTTGNGDPRTANAAVDRLTAGRLAATAGVGVETIRYYQSRGLLPVPKAVGAFRRYPIATIERIAFIKRAQTLGFTLDEVRSLLDLEDGRNRRAIQSVVSARLAQIEAKLDDLERMRGALGELLQRCRTTGQAHPCPIISTLAASTALA